MKKTIGGAFAAFVLGATSASVQAADLGPIKGPPPAPAFVDTYQPFQVRIHASAIVPDSGGARIQDAFGLGPAGTPGLLPAIGLSTGPGSVVPRASTNISWSVLPTADVSYYFTKNFAVEAICCFSYHHVQGVGTLAGGSLAHTWVFPPSILFQYHHTGFGAFQPYFGVGVNFTAYFSDAGRNLWFLAAPVGIVAPATFYSTSITPSWGPVVQVGFDYMFNENWGVNFDLKRVLMEPTVHASIFVPPFLGVPLFVPVTGKAFIDPWVASVGVTYRFGAGFGLGPVLASF